MALPASNGYLSGHPLRLLFCLVRLCLAFPALDGEGAYCGEQHDGSRDREGRVHSVHEPALEHFLRQLLELLRKVHVAPAWLPGCQ